MNDGLMSRNGVDMDEKMRGKRIGGGLGEITVNGATKGFPGVLPGFLAGLLVRSVGRMKILSF